MLLKGGAAVVIIMLWLMFLAPAALGGPVSLIWVSGSSMEPTMETGDLAVLYRRDAYAVDDIVAFVIPEGGNVIHRVAREGPSGYEFRGDNRDRDDPWVLDAHAILGREIFTIPGAARMVKAFTQPWVFGVLVAAFVLLFSNRPENQDDSGSLGPGYLAWGVVPGRAVWIWPTVRRHRRRSRAKQLIGTYRSELIAFQQWPTTQSAEQPKCGAITR